MQTVVTALALTIFVSACATQRPTPGPFPVDGVRQLTADYAFYQDLMWSPAGNLIAATRCPLLQFTPSCLGNEETILIDPANGELHLVDFEPLTSNFVNSYPLAWSRSGEQLLLYVRESPDENRAQLSESTDRYIVVRPMDGGFEEISVEGAVFDWKDEDASLLLMRSNGDGLLELGWYSYLTGDFRREIIYDDSEKLGGPHRLSPDGSALMRGNSMSPTRCTEVDKYAIGSYSEFVTILTLACYPAWSQNGTKIAFARKDHPQGEPNQIMIAGSDGSDPQPLFGNQLVAFLASPTWSPDGTVIAFTRGGLENANAIYTAPVPESMRP